MSMTQTQQQSVPSLRFPEFSGEWAIARVGSLATKIGSGVTPKGGSDVYQDSGIPLLRSQNVRNNKLYLADVAFISEEINAKMKGSAVKPHDVLLNITGASIGRSCVVPSDIGTANVNQHVCIIRLDSSSSPDFLQSFLASHRGQKLIFQSQSGSGREGLNFENIKTFKTAFPNLPEQQKIASFLSSVDGKIEQLGKKKALLEQYKKGMMQKLFSQELRFKNAQGNDFPEWEEKRLGDVATFTKGKGISKSEVADNGATPCIRYGQLYTQYAETISEVISKTNVPVGQLVISKQNDVIIPASGETALDIATASCVMLDGIALGGDLNIIRSSMNGVFLAYYLNSNKKIEIARLAQGISVVHLYAGQLKTLLLSVPTSAEQQKIADFLSSVDQKIGLISIELNHAKTFKKGLLQQMFT